MASMARVSASEPAAIRSTFGSPVDVVVDDAVAPAAVASLLFPATLGVALVDPVVPAASLVARPLVGGNGVPCA